MKLKDLRRQAKNVYCFRTMVFLYHYNWPREEIMKEANAVWRDALFDRLVSPKDL